MTRKDYVAIAGVISEVARTPGMDLPTLTATASLLADVLQADNPAFDRQRFMQASFALTVREVTR